MSFTNLQQETTALPSAHLHTGFPRDIILECFSCPACQQGPEDTAGCDGVSVHHHFRPSRSEGCVLSDPPPKLFF